MAADGHVETVTEKVNTLRWLQNGSQVHLIVNGKHVATMPWQTVHRVCEVGSGIAKMAEHHERLSNREERNKLLDDQGVLLQAGIPVNLGVPEDLLRPMKHSASIPSTAVVGRPRVILGPPPVNDDER